MHVTLVGAHPLPEEPCTGGVERVVQVLRRKLAKKVQTSLVVPAAKQALRHTDEYGVITYLKQPRIPGFLSYWSLCSKAAFREIERLSPDIVHVQDMAGFALLWPRRRAPPHPIVFTAHGVLEKDLLFPAEKDVLRHLTASVRAAVVGAVERRSRNKYNDIIVINKYVLEAMPDIAGARHHFISNPVDDIFFSAPQGHHRNQSGYHLLQAGVVSPRKNILASINIIREVAREGLSVHLHIVGPLVDPPYYEQCLREISRLNLESFITFHGNASPCELAAWMDRSDVLLLLSKQETSPMVVAEAHCRGLPVAVTRAFGLPSMVDENLNGIFLDGPTAADDSRRLKEFLIRPVDRSVIRQHAASKYKVESIIDQTINVYRTALA